MVEKLSNFLKVYGIIFTVNENIFYLGEDMKIKERIEELKNSNAGLTLYSSQELKDLERIVKLKEDLDKYRDSYYNDNESLVSDYEFDILLKELESLEEKYPEYKEASSPTASVGASLKENKFKKSWTCTPRC